MAAMESDKGRGMAYSRTLTPAIHWAEEEEDQTSCTLTDALPVRSCTALSGPELVEKTGIATDVGVVRYTEKNKDKGFGPNLADGHGIQYESLIYQNLPKY